MSQRPLTSVQLGLMQGSPPSPERLVTPDNWIDGPFNRWGFLHVRELARTARIWRGDGPVRALPSAPRDDLAAVRVSFEDSTVPLADALAQTYTDGICVIHDGRVVYEHYVDGMRPDDTHLLMSVSKSLTATLIGVLVGQGVLDPAADITDCIGALRGTPWQGCTIQHLLDMRAGTRFDEDDYLDPTSDGVLIEYISGYRPNPRPDLPADTYQWIMKLDNDRGHGDPFKYRSILTDVLSWAAAEATGRRFPDLFSDLIWSRIGAEQNADVIVDSAGFPAVEGGICTTLRDLARFGLMHLQDGQVDGRQVVPTGWINRLLVRDDQLIAAFEDDMWPHRPNAYYHDQWWVWDADQGAYSGYGINGQQLLIHRPTNTVVARFSSWPQRWSDRLAAYSDVTTVALVDHLANASS
jgi:CubicO group peptidase (beta-lactamase class C family)